MMQMAFHGPVNASPARPRRSREVPALPEGGDLARGQSLYADHCASCHGTTGQGDGPGAAGLSPTPANLADHEYTSARVAQALWNGVAGTAMSGWRDHTPTDLSALVTAVRTLRPAAQEPAPAEGQLEQGAAVYQQHCAQCHGARGDGQGTAAAQLTVAPADFTAQRATLARATRAIRRGVPGTPMAPFTTELTDADVAAVAHYVRSLYTGAPGAARP
jgi:mono/diheme cytochrome c family protein